MGSRFPVDGAVAASVALASLGFVAWGGEAGARPPEAVAVALLLVASASYAFHRRAPVAAYLVTMVSATTYLVLGYPGGGELPSVAAATYAVAAAGHRWTVGGVTLAFLGAALVHRVGTEGESFLGVAVSSSVLPLVALLGDGVHTRRALRAETRERMRLVAVEHAAEARARIAEERVRLAHELHDVIAHTITTMTVQAGAAIDLLDREPGRAREPLEGVRAAAREAMVELRSVLDVLRLPDGVADRSPVKGLRNLSELVRTMAAAGLDVEVVPEGPGDRELPPAIDAACFRVVQEACTNVLRHAGASRVVVRLTYGRSTVAVEVVDDGRSSRQPNADGYGLVGLRERVAAIGGRLEAGRAAGGGFRVAASLPRPVGTPS